MIKQIGNDIENGIIEYLLKNITGEMKQDFIVEINNVKYQLTSSDNQNNKYYRNITTIKLGQCENTLKDYYKINKNDTLIIFKVDIYEKGLLIPIVEYEVFDSYTYKKLDLNICEKDKIHIYIPMNMSKDELDKHNPNSDYYNDICYPTTSDNGTDIILIDRAYEFVNKNLTLCENNCTFNDYDFELNQTECECEVKSTIDILSDIIINKDQLLNLFTDIEKFSNIEVIKCYKLLFSKDTLLKNIGNYILLITIIFYIISLFIFVLKGYNSLINQINEIIKSKGKKRKYNIINKNINNKKNNKKISFKNNYRCKNNKKIKNKNNNPPTKKRKIINKKKISNNNNNSLTIYKNNNSNTSKNIMNNSLLLKEKNTKKKKNYIKSNNFTDYELNSFNYNKALIYDKRKYFDYYLSLIKNKHIIIFCFFVNNDYNSKIIKICLFCFSFDLYITVNALFFNDDIIHEIYENPGAYDFFFIYNIFFN